MCDTCRRIQNGNYADLRMIDGSKRTIKKEDCEKLMEQFQNTALEAYGKKIYIVEACENLTGGAANSLLKFIEEPMGDVTAILCTSVQEKVLPTIISRCQNIPFRPIGPTRLYELAKTEGMEDLHAHILSHSVRNLEEVKAAYEEAEYQEAVGIWLQFIQKSLDNVNEAVRYLLSKDAILVKNTKSKDDEEEDDSADDLQKQKKSRQKSIFQWFLQTGIIFYEDLLHETHIEDKQWEKLQSLCKGQSVTHKLQVLLQAQQRLEANSIVALTIDELGYQWNVKEE